MTMAITTATMVIGSKNSSAKRSNSFEPLRYCAYMNRTELNRIVEYWQSENLSQFMIHPGITFYSQQQEQVWNLLME